MNFTVRQVGSAMGHLAFVAIIPGTPAITMLLSSWIQKEEILRRSALEQSPLTD